MIATTTLTFITTLSARPTTFRCTEYIDFFLQLYIQMFGFEDIGRKKRNVYWFCGHSCQRPLLLFFRVAGDAGVTFRHFEKHVKRQICMSKLVRCSCRSLKIVSESCA